MKISIVSPVYRAKNIVPKLIEQIKNEVVKISNDYEIILIDDNCPDNSWESIISETKKDNKVKGIKLSRNFGQHEAVLCGLNYVTGDWIVVMDCDLQDNPKEIINFYSKAIDGKYDQIVSVRKNKKDSWFKKFTSYIFIKVYSFLVGQNVKIGISNFGIYSKNVINSVIRLNEKNRNFGVLTMWVGYNRYEYIIEQNKREEGKSSYSFFRRFNLAINSAITYSDKLLLFTVKLGLILSFLSLISSVYIVYRYFFHFKPILGWTSLITVILLSTGLIIISIGIIGIYISKIFEQVKNRPNYIIEHKINF